MPEYISGRQRKLNVGIRSYSENTDTVKVIGNILVSSGNIGVGVTDPTQDIDVNNLRIRDTIYDYTNSGGVFGYYLVKDTEGIKWVAVPPIDSNAIFIAENNNILGVSSFTGVNIVVSDDTNLVTPNPLNPNFADITIIPRWVKSGETGIYTTKNVGIGTTIPLADFQVGFGTTGVTIDGSSGIISAIGYYGDFAILNNLLVNENATVGFSSVLNELNVIGIGSTSIVAYLASAGGITTTGGDLYVGGVLYAANIEIEDINVNNISVSGIASINVAKINELSVSGITSLNDLDVTGITSTKNIFIDGDLNVSGITTTDIFNAQTGIITNIVSVAATIQNLTVVNSVIENQETENISISGIATITTADITDLSVSGITTLNDLNVTGFTSTKDLFVDGVTTSTTINSQLGIITNIVSVASTIQNLTANKFVSLDADIINLVGSAATFTNIDTDNITSIDGSFSNIDVTNLVSLAATVTSLDVDNIVVGFGITAQNLDIQNAEIDSLVSTAATVTNLDVSFADIDNLVSTAATITTLSGTNLNYSGISTLNNIDVINAEIDNLRTQNIFNSGIITTANLNVESGFDVYADTSVFHDNVIIQGNLTVNGTEVIINVDEKYIKDKQIILGFSTTNNVNDTTANGGGIAIASSVGYPLVSLNAVGVNTVPDTYKQLIWTKANTYGVGTTDAFLFNYAVGIGSNLVPNGVRLAVGRVQITDDTINSLFINSDTAIIVNLDVNKGEIDNLVGLAATITDIDVDSLVGSAATITSLSTNNLVSIAASLNTLNVNGISTFSNGPVLVGSGTSTGTVNQRLQVTGGSYFTGNVGIGTTIATRTLDILGDTRLRGQIFDRFNSAGTPGAVLTSDPDTLSWYWAEPPPLVFDILSVLDDVTYYPTLRLNGIGSAAYLQIDDAFDSGFAYKVNPARLGIGTTNPQFNLDVYGSGRFTDSINIVNNITAFGATFTILNVEFADINYTTGIGASYTGIITANSFVGNLTGTATNAEGLVGGPNLNVGIVTAIEYYGIFKGTLDPNVILEYANNAGVATYASVAGVSTNVIGGIASVSQLSVNGISTFVNGPVLIGIGTSTGTPSQILQVAGNSYISGSLGIGSTTPQYKLDIAGDTKIEGNLYVNSVITGGADTEEIVLSSSGILSTNSLAPVTVDSFGITSYRSAKYVVQITSNNSLGIGTTISIKNLIRGVNYFPGTYSNIPLISSTDNGANATATITVLPQFTLGITTCLAGVFTFTGSAVGMATGQTLTFNQTLNILPLEQSKLTGIQLNSSGFGYTTIPTITVEAPTITGNTVPGVGVGSTALAVVNSMNVQNFNIDVGIATTTIPTVIISGPSVGTTATGIVGVGVSQITVNNVGSAYTVSPNISIPKVTGFAASVGLGISSLNWQTTTGSGYTLPTISVDGVNGIGTGAIVEADVDSNAPNGLINFRITNVGLGYTRPPIVTITDATGVGAAVTITTMTVSDVVVNNIGSGSTTGISTSDIIVSPIGGIGTGAVMAASLIVPTNVVITNVGSGYTIGNIPVTATFSNPSIAATVGLGVETISITSSGIGYTILPTLTFSSPTLGIGSTADGSSNKLGYDQTALFNGPGLANTTAVYYVQPLSANTFGISTISSGPRITLGYGVTPPTTRASIGGTVNNVNITFGGSGYVVDDIITASNFESPKLDTNVGTGFSFRVNSTVNAFQISDLLVLQTASGGNPNAFVVESSGISDASDLGEFSADISGGNTRLRFTPVYANNQIKFFKTLFRI